MFLNSQTAYIYAALTKKLLLFAKRKRRSHSAPNRFLKFPSHYFWMRKLVYSIFKMYFKTTCCCMKNTFWRSWNSVRDWDLCTWSYNRSILSPWLASKTDLCKWQWCRWGSFHETEVEVEAELTRPRRGKAEAEAVWLEAEARPRQNVRGRGKAVRKQCKCLSYRRNYVTTNWQLKIMLVFIKSYCSCLMHVQNKV